MEIIEVAVQMKSVVICDMIIMYTFIIVETIFIHRNKKLLYSYEMIHLDITHSAFDTPCNTAQRENKPSYK